MKNILIIEDTQGIADLERDYFEANGYGTTIASDGQEGLDLALKNEYDLIICDVMLPTVDGFHICRELRAKKDTPIIMVTAKTEEIDKIRGLGLGADDYMVKPIDIEEMLLRIQVLLRRSKSASEKKIQIGDLLLNYNQLSVIKKDKVYNLAQKEFYLLYKLLSTPNTIFTRQELIEEVWGLESDSDYRTVDVHIKRIREKMKDVDEFEIVTIRGIGYKAIIHEKG